MLRTLLLALTLLVHLLLLLLQKFLLQIYHHLF